jgi:hypothetical protein
MESTAYQATTSKSMIWTGRILSWLVGAFLLVNSIFALLRPPEVVEGTVKMGYPESAIVVIGGALLGSAILYLIPQTAVLGAILLTGYLGGAVATHVRVGDPILNILTPVVFGVVIWGALYLRDARLRALVPLR